MVEKKEQHIIIMGQSRFPFAGHSHKARKIAE